MTNLSPQQAFNMMLLLSFVALITLLSAQAARAAPSPLIPRSIGDYKIVPMQWTGQVHPGGPNITLEGDMQDIINQIKTMDPAFKFPQPSEEEMKTFSMEPLASNTTLAKRQYPTYTLCNRREFRDADIYYINHGEMYLYSLHGLCTLPAGAGQCSRVSCSYGSGIYYCNDADHPQYINCAEIGWYSNAARHACGATASRGKFNAQRFRTDYQYSVLDAWGNC